MLGREKTIGLLALLTFNTSFATENNLNNNKLCDGVNSCGCNYVFADAQTLKGFRQWARAKYGSRSSINKPSQAKSTKIVEQDGDKALSMYVFNVAWSHYPFSYSNGAFMELKDKSVKLISMAEVKKKLCPDRMPSSECKKHMDSFKSNVCVAKTSYLGNLMDALHIFAKNRCGGALSNQCMEEFENLTLVGLEEITAWESKAFKDRRTVYVAQNFAEFYRDCIQEQGENDTNCPSHSSWRV